MKPPFRRRNEPSRFHKIPQQEQQENPRTLCKGWIRKDLQSFLHALKQQDFESELDLTEIQKKVPQRSLKEIEDLVNTLKSRVLQKVYLQVQSQRKEEHKAKVPIEIWGDLVQKMSRTHEKTISTAFSQMLVVAATEPCGLVHSEPPHPITQTLAFSNLHRLHSFKTPSRPSTSGMSPNSSVSTASAVAFIRPESSSSAVDNIGKSDTASGSLPQVPTTPGTPTPTSSSSQPQSKAKATVSSPSSTTPVSQTASSDKHNPALMEMLGHDYLHKPRLMKPVVNFHKIYQYLSDIDSKTCSSHLTSMECAVLLDVLMCLPEELPLLDCKELQHHLLQLHLQLSKPTAKLEPSSDVPLTDSTTSAEKPSTTAGSSEEPSRKSEPARDKQDWARAGICPLNPLSVPVTLLKRKSLDSEKWHDYPCSVES